MCPTESLRPMLTKKGRARGEAILEPLLKALDDLSRSITALHKSVASLGGQVATRSPKPGAAGSKPGKAAQGSRFKGKQGRPRK